MVSIAEIGVRWSALSLFVAQRALDVQLGGLVPAAGEAQLASLDASRNAALASLRARAAALPRRSVVRARVEALVAAEERCRRFPRGSEGHALAAHEYELALAALRALLAGRHAAADRPGD